MRINNPTAQSEMYNSLMLTSPTIVLRNGLIKIDDFRLQVL